MKIYLAAPLFTQAERVWNRQFAARLGELKPELEIILPQDTEADFRDGKTDFSVIFKRNVESIDGAEAVIAVLDGSDSDSGTSWECGYAFAKGKPVIGVRTDFRKSEDGNLNAMLAESAILVFQPSFNESLDALAEAAAAAVETALSDARKNGNS
ncbi:MAG: nucleoside 2-deoxyribosyltransferase [Deltaproteobacteria bacterium]